MKCCEIFEADESLKTTNQGPKVMSFVKKKGLIIFNLSAFVLTTILALDYTLKLLLNSTYKT